MVNRGTAIVNRPCGGGVIVKEDIGVVTGGGVTVFVRQHGACGQRSGRKRSDRKVAGGAGGGEKTEAQGRQQETQGGKEEDGLKRQD